MWRVLSRGRWPLACALAITFYAGLLRLDAYVAKYGTINDPAWARPLTNVMAPLGARLRPFEAGWPPETRPYVGGDPINYIRFAREMTSFYQPHVREPVFLALTRLFLWLLGGKDGAVSFASATGSLLAVLGTYALAAMLMPRLVALAAALVVAVDRELITWAVDGWRDDVVMASVVWTLWALLRLRERPTVANAVFVGVCGGLACLTRITAFIFVLPGLAWFVLDSPAESRRIRIRTAAIASAVLALLVAPYLVSCAIAFGDPLFAINYHTVYYRHGEGMPTDATMSAADYLRMKFTRHPIATIDTGVTGLFVQPFVTKWGGLEPSLGAARHVLVWSAFAGLLMLPWIAAGRLLLIVLFTSLLPYAFTWNIGDGGAWRFTMHAYPLYIVAGCYAIATVARFAVSILRDRRVTVPSTPVLATFAVLAVSIVAVPYAYAAMPWFIVREALAKGEDVNLETGRRDHVFYVSGWSAPRGDRIVFRVSDGDRSVVRFPLPVAAAYEIALRVDPVLPEMQQRLSVLVNRHFVAKFSLTFNPERFGSYRFRVQPHQVNAGRNELVLVPESFIPASAAGPSFAWLPPSARLGVRLWYVRILLVPNEKQP